MKVQVKKKHIRQGKDNNINYCPIALALTDVFKREYVEVYPKYALISAGRENLPRSAQKFIRDFDSGRKVKTFNFILKGTLENGL